MTETLICSTRTNEFDFFVFFQFENEFRRFAVKRGAITSYQEFFQFVQNVHRLYEIPFSIWYKEPLHGDVLPINNNENCLHALNSAQPMLRLFLQRGGMLFFAFFVQIETENLQNLIEKS